ncbi:hypothetical protein ACIQU5_32050 [Streptomyces sp. NPDC090306]|uniref:hypothetical protein n=1 Tax=Streptomyces sp. NPDC090306 TaxID=3365961 RepID=UPI0037FFBDFD
MPTPTIGRIVLYQLAEQDAATITAVRQQTGRQGNSVRAGDVFPALVVGVWAGSSGPLNLSVFLDGQDTHWATSRVEGREPGNWAWPDRT